MLFAVVRLRIKGRCLTRSEVDAQPRAVGDLVITAPPHSAQGRDPLKRPTRVAELQGEPIGGICHTLIANLMEPRLTVLTSNEFVLFGYECEFVDKQLHEFAQGWLVRHAEGERRMRRGDVPHRPVE